jgi:hypothetical protein
MVHKNIIIILYNIIIKKEILLQIKNIISSDI